MLQIFHLLSIIQFNIFSVKEVPNPLVEINVTLEIQTKNESLAIPIRDYDLGKSLNVRSYFYDNKNEKKSADYNIIDFLIHFSTNQRLEVRMETPRFFILRVDIDHFPHNLKIKSFRS